MGHNELEKNVVSLTCMNFSLSCEKDLWSFLEVLCVWMWMCLDGYGSSGVLCVICISVLV